MRSIWNGSINFGLVNVPVKLFGATEDHDVKSHQVHKDCGKRVRYSRVCEDGHGVEYADIVKGFEHGDELVILSEDELSSISEDRNRVIDVLEFVPAEDLDPLMFGKPYYVTPNKSEKSYKLLTTALAGTERVAIVKFALRGPTRLGALRVIGKQNLLTIQVMLWPDEVREPAFPVLDKLAKIEVSEKEATLAHMVIESMHNEFNPDRYRDTYQEDLRELVAAKAAGSEIVVEDVEAAEATDVDDLLAKLEASIAKKGNK